MSQSDAASEADDEQPISGEIQYGIPPRRYGLIIVAMLACIAVALTTKEVVGSHHAKMERVPTDAIAVFSDKMKASAGNEPAWNGAGQKVGLQIWRIINWKVVAVPKDVYGEFYDGDCYIVLNTYEKDGDLQFDIHYWIGKYTTQDEYGSAAIKASQLAQKLNDRDFTHREVMNFESPLFKSYFDSMKIVKGGANSGYREKVQKEIETNLWVATKDGMRRVVPTTSSLKSENVYAIMHGLRLYQWNGAKAPSTFKLVAATFRKGLFDSDPRIKITVLEEIETTANHPAMLLLQKEEKNAKSGPATLPSKSGADSGYREKVLMWVATKDKMRVVPTTSSLKSENVYAIRHGLRLYQWNGAKAPSTFKLVAAKFRKGLFDSDPRIKITVLEERETTANHPAMLLLQKEEKNAKSGPATLPRRLLKLTASLDLEVLSGLEEANLKTENVLFVDTAEAYWIWVGKGASVDQRKNCMAYASNELSKSETPWRAIRLIQEGKETDEFRKVFTNA